MTNPDALQELANLLVRPSNKLRLLGVQPLAIASARNKFNDAHNDDYWCAVQLCQYRWEQSQFFGSPSGQGIAKQFSTGSLAAEDYGSVKAEAQDIAAARDLLRELDNSGWHDLASKAIDQQSHGGILALVVQFEQVWLHCSDPQGHFDDQIFALIDGRLEKLATVDDRFDGLVGSAELISCYDPDPEVVEKLTPAAKAHFGSEIQDTEASADLATSLIKVALRLDDLTHDAGNIQSPIAIRLGIGWKDLRYPWVRHGLSANTSGARFAIGERYYDRPYFHTLTHSADRLADAASRLREIEEWPFEKTWEFLQSIDQTQIRKLFERATGTDTFDSDDFYLLISHAAPYLLFGNRLYRFDLSGISALGNERDLNDPLGFDTSEWMSKLRYIFATPQRRLE